METLRVSKCTALRGAEISRSTDPEILENWKHLFLFLNTDKPLYYGPMFRKALDIGYERVGTCVAQTDLYTFIETERERSCCSGILIAFR